MKKIKDSEFDGNIFKDMKINLIDFGMSKRFLHPETGKHLQQHYLLCFTGNIFSASINQL